MSNRRIVIGISGASCSIIGIKLLEFLKEKEFETHLIITEEAKKILEYETNYKAKDVEKLATYVYSNNDFFAPIASGSFKADAMVVVPCSMKTLAGMAHGFTDNLLLRTADVFMKERRKLVIVPRETPLSVIHTENIHKVSLAGAIVLPAMMSFYSRPKTTDDMVNHVLGKILDILNIENSIYARWNNERNNTD